MQPQPFHLLWEPIAKNQGLILVALAFIVLDILLGFSGAVKNQCVSSKVMREGLWHKLGSISLIAVSDIIDGALLGGVDLGFPAPVLAGVCLYISLMELVSVLENITILNPELRNNPLMDMFAKKEQNHDTGSK